MKIGKTRLTIAVFVSIILGVLAGGGIAWAHNVNWDIVGGSYIYGPVTHNNQYNMPTYNYDQDHAATADNSYPNTTSLDIVDWQYLNGYSDPNSDPVQFWLAYIYDSPNSRTEEYLGWECVPVNNVDQTQQTADFCNGDTTCGQWNNLGSSHTQVTIEQDLWVVPPPNTCAGDINQTDDHEVTFIAY